MLLVDSGWCPAVGRLSSHEFTATAASRLQRPEPGHRGAAGTAVQTDGDSDATYAGVPHQVPQLSPLCRGARSLANSAHVELPRQRHVQGPPSSSLFFVVSSFANAVVIAWPTLVTMGRRRKRLDRHDAGRVHDNSKRQRELEKCVVRWSPTPTFSNEDGNTTTTTLKYQQKSQSCACFLCLIWAMSVVFLFLSFVRSPCKVVM